MVALTFFFFFGGAVAAAAAAGPFLSASCIAGLFFSLLLFVVVDLLFFLPTLASRTQRPRIVHACMQPATIHPSLGVCFFYCFFFMPETMSSMRRIMQAA